MSKVLFDGIDEIPNEIVIEKMKYFINEAKVGKELFQSDKKESLLLAKRLRKELEQEYKNNSLDRTRKRYKNHKLFSAFYTPAVQDAYVKITGPLSYEKLYGFLYDVEDYMNYHLPCEYK
ncbi:hypothetical protein ACFTQ7_08530 [Lysinibacillus sp. NPDC056959]|uniref:hypothetical protein n=1 Tax=Lysinibacillus sp. NPDC056959 TaxID=3345981 RepID=UPI00363F9D9E